MEITINTHVDDLPAVIRMLQAYCEESPAGRLHKPAPEQAFATVENYVGQAGGSGGNGQPPKSLFDAPLATTVTVQGEVSSASTRRTDVTVDADAPEEPAPEQVFAAPKSLFDEPDQPPLHTDVTVDAAGLPWDARIHSGAKSKLANGNWKRLRGVDPDLVASVEAELRGAPEPAEDATDPSPAPTPPAPPAAPPATPAPAAPSAPPAAPKPITNAAELVAAVMDKRFTTDQVNVACQAVGVENVASLLATQDKLPAVLKELGV